MARGMKEVREFTWGTRNRDPNRPHAVKPHDYSWAITLALSIQVARMRKKNLYLRHLCPRGLTTYSDEATSPSEESSSHTLSTDKKKIQVWGTHPQRWWLSRSGVGCRNLHFNKFAGDSDMGTVVHTLRHVTQPLCCSAWRYIPCITHLWIPHKASQHSGDVSQMPVSWFHRRGLSPCPTSPFRHWPQANWTKAHDLPVAFPVGKEALLTNSRSAEL